MRNRTWRFDESMRAPTAQEAFKEMLRSAIAPALRALGFKGSGQTFELADERFWAFLGFQKSLSSDRSVVKFTVNLCVIDKAQYSKAREEASYLPAKPTPNVRGGPGWWERIGEVLPQRHDLWWMLREGDPTVALAKQVVLAIEAHGLPAMRARML
jgi:hypothetical protein